MNKNQKEDNDGDGEGNNKRGRLNLETISYFKRVGSVLEENTFEDENHKDAFIKNVFNQIESDGVQLSRHHITSRVLESVIPLFTSEQFRKFMEIIGGSGETIQMVCCDRFGSHVVEQFFKQILNYREDEETVDCFVKLCKTIRKEVDFYLRDMYGSHVLSTLLQVLSGVALPDKFNSSRTQREKKKGKRKSGASFQQKEKLEVNFKEDIGVSEVPEALSKMYMKFMKAIKGDDNFGELLCHHSACPVLQVLLITLSKVDSDEFAELTQLVIRKGRIPLNENEVDEEEDEETINKLPVVLADHAGSYLFEVLLQTSDEETFKTLATKCLRHVAGSLSLHPTANFLLQTLLRCTKEIEQAELLVKKLIPLTEDILAAGHMGCIVRVAELLARMEMKSHQKEFINTLKQSLHIPCEDEEMVESSLAKLIVCLMTYDVFYKIDETAEEGDAPVDTTIELQKNMLNYHGTCLLKHCLEFEKCRIVVNSVVKLSANELILVACHPSGSFAFESLLANKWIKVKQKNKLAAILTKNISELARDKFGSRVVDSLWNAVSPDSQTIMKEELCKNKSKLMGDMYGRIVLSNCGVNRPTPRKKEFMERQEKKHHDFQGSIHTKTNKNFKDGNSIAPNFKNKRKGFGTDIVIKEEEQQPVKKKKKNENDRVAKYQAQLKSLGISYNYGGN